MKAKRNKSKKQRIRIYASVKNIFSIAKYSEFLKRLEKLSDSVRVHRSGIGVEYFNIKTKDGSKNVLQLFDEFYDSGWKKLKTKRWTKKKGFYYTIPTVLKRIENKTSPYNNIEKKKEGGKITDTEAFKKWFGNSIVTDNGKTMAEGGEPLVVYHGGNYDFNTFIDNKKDGIFFAKNIELAKLYGKNIYPAYLKVENIDTLIHTKNKWWKDKYPLVTEAIDSMMTKGMYDAILLKETADPPYYNEAEKQIYSDIYIVKKSNQIKLADGTNTKFDPNNPDIRLGKGGCVREAEFINEKVASTNSIYQTWKKNGTLFKVRYSDHPSNILKADSDLELNIKIKDTDLAKDMINQFINEKIDNRIILKYGINKNVLGYDIIERIAGQVYLKDKRVKKYHINQMDGMFSGNNAKNKKQFLSTATRKGDYYYREGYDETILPIKEFYRKYPNVVFKETMKAGGEITLENIIEKIGSGELQKQIKAKLEKLIIEKQDVLRKFGEIRNATKIVGENDVLDDTDGVDDEYLGKDKQEMISLSYSYFNDNVIPALENIKSELESYLSENDLENLIQVRFDMSNQSYSCYIQIQSNIYSDKYIEENDLDIQEDDLSELVDENIGFDVRFSDHEDKHWEHGRVNIEYSDANYYFEKGGEVKQNTKNEMKKELTREQVDIIYRGFLDNEYDESITKWLSENLGIGLKYGMGKSDAFYDKKEGCFRNRIKPVRINNKLGIEGFTQKFFLAKDNKYNYQLAVYSETFDDTTILLVELKDVAMDEILPKLQDLDIKKIFEEKTGIDISKGTGTGLKYEAVPKELTFFMPDDQIEIVNNSIGSFQSEIERLMKAISEMPKSYETEKTPTAEKIVYLHYFSGNSDWFIIEKDKGDPEDEKELDIPKGTQRQAYGHVVLNGDTQNAEWGYVDISEIKKIAQVELDFHYTPIPFEEAYNVKFPKTAEEEKEIIEVQPEKEVSERSYVLGDMWREDFDAKGMLKYAIDNNFSEKTDIKLLEQLFESFQDFNFHEQGGKLWKCIKAIKNGEKVKSELLYLDFEASIIKQYKEFYGEDLKTSPVEEKTQVANVEKAPISIEWSEGLHEENIPVNSLEELNEKLKQAGFTERSTETYIKNKIDFSGSDLGWDTVRIDSSRTDGDFNFEKEHVKDYLLRTEPNLDWKGVFPNDYADIQTEPKIKENEYVLPDTIFQFDFTDPESENVKHFVEKFSRLDGIYILIENCCPNQICFTYENEIYCALDNTTEFKVYQHESIEKLEPEDAKEFIGHVNFPAKSHLQSANIVSLQNIAEELYELISGYEEVIEKTENTPEDSPLEEVVSVNDGQPPAKGKTQLQITTQIRSLIDKNGLDKEKYSEAELNLLRLYDGLGGLAKQGYTIGSLSLSEMDSFNDQFFTPIPIIRKMWGLAYKHGFTPSSNCRILEPAVATGRVLEFAPEQCSIDAFETDKYPYVICKLSYPDINLKHESFETLFFQNKMHVGTGNLKYKYDLVIGNPPYKAYNSKYSNMKVSGGKSEKQETLAETFDQYFIMRGVDVLVSGGLLIYVVPNTFLSNKTKYNNFKELLAGKCKLVEAFRLPNGIFPNTQVGTDIIVLKKF